MAVRAVPGGSPSGSFFASNDVQMLSTIHQILSATVAGPTPTEVRLSNREVSDAVLIFKQIQTDKVILLAFAAAIFPGKDFSDVVPDPGRQFYQALPQHLQERFKDALWTTIGGAGNGFSVAQYLIDSKITGSEIAKRAIQAML